MSSLSFLYYYISCTQEKSWRVCYLNHHLRFISTFFIFIKEYLWRIFFLLPLRIAKLIFFSIIFFIKVDRGPQSAGELCFGCFSGVSIEFLHFFTKPEQYFHKTIKLGWVKKIWTKLAKLAVSQCTVHWITAEKFETAVRHFVSPKNTKKHQISCYVYIYSS